MFRDEELVRWVAVDVLIAFAVASAISDPFDSVPMEPIDVVAVYGPIDQGPSHGHPAILHLEHTAVSSSVMAPLPAHRLGSERRLSGLGAAQRGHDGEGNMRTKKEEQASK
jgi:hypothetical protein